MSKRGSYVQLCKSAGVPLETRPVCALRQGAWRRDGGGDVLREEQRRAPVCGKGGGRQKSAACESGAQLLPISRGISDH